MKLLRRRRAGDYLTRDRCEVCGKPLVVKDRVEVLTVLEQTDSGGSGFVSCYCRKHSPKKVKA